MLPCHPNSQAWQIPSSQPGSHQKAPYSLEDLSHRNHPRCCHWSRYWAPWNVFFKGCGIVLGILFFFWLEVVLGLSRLLFGETQGWNAGFVWLFRTFGGTFRAVQPPFWWNVVKCGEMQVSCGLNRKNCRKKHVSRSFLFSVCVYLRMFVCVCL